MTSEGREIHQPISFFQVLKSFEKYKDSKDSGIIGHFGLGFYSAFYGSRKSGKSSPNHIKTNQQHTGPATEVQSSL
jgi:hypothetical protein